MAGIPQSILGSGQGQSPLSNDFVMLCDSRSWSTLWLTRPSLQRRRKFGSCLLNNFINLYRTNWHMIRICLHAPKLWKDKLLFRKDLFFLFNSFCYLVSIWRFGGTRSPLMIRRGLGIICCRWIQTFSISGIQTLSQRGCLLLVILRHTCLAGPGRTPVVWTPAIIILLHRARAVQKSSDDPQEPWHHLLPLDPNVQHIWHTNSESKRLLASCDPQAHLLGWAWPNPSGLNPSHHHPFAQGPRLQKSSDDPQGPWHHLLPLDPNVQHI